MGGDGDAKKENKKRKVYIKKKPKKTKQKKKSKQSFKKRPKKFVLKSFFYHN